jgi:hypothetical protein
MKKWINQAFRWYYRQRYKGIEYFMRHPHEVQRRWLSQLLNSAKYTEWGKRHRFNQIHTPEDFSRMVPLQDYESIKPYIQRMMHGERDVLWSGQVQWFSKSSGTTSDKSKFLPVSSHNLKKCHIRGTWDTMALYYHQRPQARLFEAKSLMVGGSLSTFSEYPDTRFGDVSAIMLHHMPLVGYPFFIPDMKTVLMDEWESKVEKLAQAGAREPNIVFLGGVPTWIVVLFRRILEITGKKHMLEVWPNFEVYIHGGVSFKPYQKQFEAFFPSEKVDYLEIYNASEGYFAVQDDMSEEGMLLLLNNGIYYEFLPMEQWGSERQQAIPLWEVEAGKQYAIVISTNAGLWRYMPGDTVVFTSTNPYRVKVTGRTKQFVNAFGEEVMVDNTDQALAETSRQLNATVAEYTVAPVYFQHSNKGGHEWLIEFEQAPADIAAFQELLDKNLQCVNSDYEAKRYKNMALAPLCVRVLPRGAFLAWMQSRGKAGGQHKVPRLANDRQYVDEILRFLRQSV